MILPLVLALTRIAADQIQGALPLQGPGTKLTVEQATDRESQLAGNVRVLRFQMTETDTAIVTELPVVVVYPVEQWCTDEEPRICP